jgi:ATP-binding cassette subfamily B protein
MARSKGMGGGPSMAFEKPRAGAKAILRRLWRYLYHYKWLLAAAVALSLTGNLLALAGPKLSGYAIDAIRPGPGRVDFNTVFHYAKRMLVFYFAAAALSYVLATLMVRLSRNVVYRMRKDIYDHLMRLPVRFFDTHAIGDVLSVLSYDVDTNTPPFPTTWYRCHQRHHRAGPLE